LCRAERTLFPQRDPRLDENSRSQLPTYVRNIETGKSKKKLLSVGEFLSWEGNLDRSPILIRGIWRREKGRKNLGTSTFFWESAGRERPHGEGKDRSLKPTCRFGDASIDVDSLTETGTKGRLCHF
jgi:hypothetical protein